MSNLDSAQIAPEDAIHRIRRNWTTDLASGALGVPGVSLEEQSAWEKAAEIGALVSECASPAEAAQWPTIHHDGIDGDAALTILGDHEGVMVFHCEDPKRLVAVFALATAALTPAVMAIVQNLIDLASS